MTLFITNRHLKSYIYGLTENFYYQKQALNNSIRLHKKLTKKDFQVVINMIYKFPDPKFHFSLMLAVKSHISATKPKTEQ